MNKERGPNRPMRGRIKEKQETGMSLFWFLKNSWLRKDGTRKDGTRKEIKKEKKSSM